MRVLIAGPLLVVVMAGCLNPLGHGEDPGRKDCVGQVCQADLKSRDAQVLRERFGWYQINADEWEEVQPQVQGDLVLWNLARSVRGDIHGDTYAFNLSSQTVIPVEVEDYYHTTRPYLAAARGIYRQDWREGAPEPPGPGYLVLWDSSTDEKRRLDVGLGGGQIAEGFDGSWVVFDNRGSEDKSDNGVWAFYVDDGRLVKLYSPLPNGRLSNGDSEWQISAAVAEGKAYYAVNRNDTVGGRNASVYRVDLATNEALEVSFSDAYTIGRMAAGGGFVAWETTVQTGQRSSVYVWTAATGEARWISTDADGLAGFPGAGGDWATFWYHSLDTGATGLAAVHVPTSKRFNLLNTTNQAGDFGVQVSDTDGVRVVAVVSRLTTKVFESGGRDLYWRELPEVQAVT